MAVLIEETYWLTSSEYTSEKHSGVQLIFQLLTEQQLAFLRHNGEVQNVLRVYRLTTPARIVLCARPPYGPGQIAVLIELELNRMQCVDTYITGQHAVYAAQRYDLPSLDVHSIAPLLFAQLHRLVISVASGEVPVDALPLHDVLPGSDALPDKLISIEIHRHDALIAL